MSERSASPRHWRETAFAALAFTAVALLAGRVFRPAFDDEIFTLRTLDETTGGMALFRHLLGGADVHPPLSYMLFYTAQVVGFGEHGMRALSLVLSAGTVALSHRLLLRLGDRHGTTWAERLVALLVLATTPLLVSQGDAIRWYPLYGFLFMAALWLHVRERDANAAAHGSSIAAGLLVSINFLGIFVFPILVLDRLVTGRFRFGREVGQAALWALFASPGLLTLAAGLAGDGASYAAPQIASGFLNAAAGTAIGFLGGHSLGVVQSIAALPMGLLAVAVLARAAMDARTRVLAFNFAAMVAMVGAGFAKPRSFLYLAAALSVLVANAWLARTRLGHCAAAVALVTAFGALANLKGNDTPFKRNSVIPVAEAHAFVIENTGEGDVVIVSDSVLYWSLRADARACVSLYLTNERCRPDDAPRLVIVEGHSSPGEIRDDYLSARERLIQGRRQVARAFFGVDEEYALKRQIEPGLGRFVLEGGVYDKIGAN